MSYNPNPRQTSGFYAQAVISFAVSVIGVLAGIAYLPANGWMRSFLALGLLYVVTSTFHAGQVCARPARVDPGRAPGRPGPPGALPVRARSLATTG